MSQATIGAKSSTGGKQSLADTPCFIEAQFPVSKLSKESYRERMAVFTQTLTGLGKWWGRKPLVLCRAAILGVLLPSTDDPKKDRETFLALMTMDVGGLLGRRLPLPLKEVFRRLAPSQRSQFFTDDSTEKKPRFKPRTKREVKDMLQELAFISMSYDDKLEYAARPEEVAGPNSKAWEKINAHLSTSAGSLPELIAELGHRRFGRVPRVGDAFCGGGSVPFEAARIGCDAYGSDLNPVATLLTWASLNIIGAGPEVADKVQAVQEAVYEVVDRKVCEWGIEHDGKGWRADAYLYCVETICPECGWRVPLSPSWVIAEKTRCIAILEPAPSVKAFNIRVVEDASDTDWASAKSDAGTVRDSKLCCPHCTRETPISAVRRDGLDGREFGLRMWEAADVVPRGDDIFQERLYCVRWFRKVACTRADGSEGEETVREYRSVTKGDLERENLVLDLLKERFGEWQRIGALPSRRIERGQETTRLLRERGWTYWHHLFNPRQLLLNGLFTAEVTKRNGPEALGILLLCGRLSDWNSRLCVWLPSNSSGIGGGKNTFLNQAFNTLFNYATRPFVSVASLALPRRSAITRPATVEAVDCRQITHEMDVWITDPPYADAVCYDELSEHYLAWYEKHLPRLIRLSSADSRRALAVRGEGESFRRSMVQCYERMAAQMPENGVQVVMFTHQNASVWADLALILWAAGLRVTAAWCIATETDAAAFKSGNYVQGTVLLVLRKKSATAEEVFLADVYQMVEAEVRRQLDAMLALDDQEDPNFTDTDYQLAAYAAALRVLTQNPIAEIDVQHELSKERARGEASPVAELIENAVKIACDHLVPRGVDRDLWRTLGKTERMYVKALEMESHGEHRNGVYQELARGFGVREYQFLLANSRANETRLKTAKELARRDLEGGGGGGEDANGDGAAPGDRKEFARSLLRQALFATFKTTDTEDTAAGMSWLKTEIRDYWNQRDRLVQLLEYLAALGQNASMPHWHSDAESARKLAGAVRNDHV